MIPLRLGSADEYKLVRDFLEQSGFTEDALRSRFAVDRLHDLVGGMDRERGRFQTALEIGDPLSLLTRLFLSGMIVSGGEIDDLVPPGVSAAFEALGLLTRDGGRVFAPVLLYPVRWTWIASDRFLGIDGGRHYTGEDFVSLAIIGYAVQLMEVLPTTACERFLELCAGAAPAALIAARFGRRVWALEIASRAVFFARFNCLLNGVENVSVLQGDMYEPVSGEQFDRIVAVPPFEPALGQADAIFAAGGADGERITRRIVEGLPAHLEPGGRMYAIGLAIDREDEPFEQRIRRWLGPQAGEFDVAVLARKVFEPMEYASQSVIRGGEGMAKLDLWRRFFEQIRATLVLFTHLIVQRRTMERPVFSVRRQFGPRTGGAEVEKLLDWETRAVEPGFDEFLDNSKPVLAPDVELLVRHQSRDRALFPIEYQFQAQQPFQVELRCNPWMAMLASRCDGAQSARELFRSLLDRGVLRGDDAAPQFRQGLSALISAGILDIAATMP